MLSVHLLSILFDLFGCRWVQMIASEITLLCGIPLKSVRIINFSLLVATISDVLQVLAVDLFSCLSILKDWNPHDK